MKRYFLYVLFLSSSVIEAQTYRIDGYGIPNASKPFYRSEHRTPPPISYMDNYQPRKTHLVHAYYIGNYPRFVLKPDNTKIDTFRVNKGVFIEPTTEDK